MRLLLTRPQRDAERTAAALRARGHTVIISPLMRIEPLPDAAIGPGPWTAVLVTSANAAHAIAASRQREALVALPVFAVGERTARAMSAGGFADVTSADGAANDLVRLVASRMPPGTRLLYLAGEDRARDLAAEFGGHGFSLQTAVVYRTVAQAELPQAAHAALAAGIDAILHFSRRSATAYVNAARGAGLIETALRPAHYCLSEQIAEPLRAAGASIIRIAPRPTESELIGLIGPKSG